MSTCQFELCANFDAKTSLSMMKLPRLGSRRDTPRPSVTTPYKRPQPRKFSFDALWEETFAESLTDSGSPTSDESTESLGARPDGDEPITQHARGGQRSTAISRSNSVIENRRTSEAVPESRSPKLGDARFAGVRPSENWTRMRARSRTGSISSKPRRPRSVSTVSLPSVDDLRNTGWRSPKIIGRKPSLSRSSSGWVPRRLSGVYSRRFSDTNVAASAAHDIARFRAATGQKVGDPTSASSACAQFKRHVVEVTGDPSGVANGTYYFTEKNSRKPFFTRHAPRKATLAPRQSHGMWFLLAWGEEKDGKPTWTDYCSPHDGDLPPRKGWRVCSRTKDRLKWEFGEEVPITVDVLKDAYPTYT